MPRSRVLLCLALTVLMLTVMPSAAFGAAGPDASQPAAAAAAPPTAAPAPSAALPAPDATDLPTDGAAEKPTAPDAAPTLPAAVVTVLPTIPSAEPTLPAAMVTVDPAVPSKTPALPETGATHAPAAAAPGADTAPAAAPDPVPKTGDSSAFSLYALLAALSGGTALLAGLNLMRSR